jgi:hypothetical protein
LKEGAELVPWQLKTKNMESPVNNGENTYVKKTRVLNDYAK